MTLVEFLMARIAEDEAFARSALALNGSGTTWPLGHPLDPARALADCEAKRRIVEAHPLVTDSDRLTLVWTGPTPGVACETCGGNPVDSSAPLEDIGPCDTLLALALSYGDHPDCREEWRP